MKLIYNGAHLKVYNMVNRSNQILTSDHFQHELKDFLRQHYEVDVVAEFLKYLRTLDCEINVHAGWKPFSKRFIYLDKDGIGINSAKLHMPSRFYISLLLERAFLVFEQKYDINRKTFQISDLEEKEDVLQGIGYLAMSGTR